MSPPLVTRCVGVLLTLTVLTAPPSYAVSIGSVSVTQSVLLSNSTPPVVAHEPAAPQTPPIITNEQLHRAYASTLLNSTLVPLLKHCAQNAITKRWCAVYIESVRAYHNRVPNQWSAAAIAPPDMPAIQLAIDANEKQYSTVALFCANWPANITLTVDGTTTGEPIPCNEFCTIFTLDDFSDIVIPVCHRIRVMDTLPLTRPNGEQSAPAPPASGHIAVVKLARTDETVVPKVVKSPGAAQAAPAAAAVSPHPTKGISASTTSATTTGKRTPSVANSSPNEAPQPKAQQEQSPIPRAAIVGLPDLKPPAQEHEQPPQPQQKEQPQLPDNMDAVTDIPPAMDAAAAAAAAAVDVALASDSLIPPAIGDVGDDIDDLEAEDEAEEAAAVAAAAAADAERKPVTASGGSSVDDSAGAEPTVQRDPFVGDEESSFFSYFMFVLVVCVAVYVLHHNRRLLLALLLEGRRRNGTGVGRRKHTAAYRKLDSNLEEAISASSSAAAGAGTSCAETAGGGRSQSIIY